MVTSAPADVASFAAWSSEATCGVLDSRIVAWFNNTQGNLFTRVGDDELLSAMDDHLVSAVKNYELENSGASLFSLGRRPQVDWHRKPSSSFLDKLFRLNIVENPAFPHPPAKGWIKPESSLAFEYINDIVRTTLVVAYADGPGFLARHIEKLAQQRGYECAVKDHSKEKGYYAHHVYLGIRLDVADRINAGFTEAVVPVEIQITTELQAALREVTHKLYEEERRTGRLAEGWKEDFKSGRFRAAYMAHSLRFIEGMIVDLRTATMTEPPK